jgi:hypothetical protein
MFMKWTGHRPTVYRSLSTKTQESIAIFPVNQMTQEIVNKLVDIEEKDEEGTLVGPTA